MNRLHRIDSSEAHLPYSERFERRTVTWSERRKDRTMLLVALMAVAFTVWVRLAGWL
jgi:hypothetical protein